MLYVLKQDSAIEFNRTGNRSYGEHGFTMGREILEDGLFGAERMLHGEPEQQIICGGPNGCSYYEVTKEVFEAFCSADERQIASLASRVSQAQHLSDLRAVEGGRRRSNHGRSGSRGADSRTAEQQLGSWFETGAGIKVLPLALERVLPPMAFPLSVNLSGCGVSTEALRAFLERKVRLAAFRCGNNCYGEEGARMIAAHISDGPMDLCRSLEVDGGQTGEGFFELILQALEQVDPVLGNGMARWDNFTVILSRDDLPMPEYVEAGERCDDTWTWLLLQSLRDTHARNRAWERLSRGEQEAAVALGWTDHVWNGSKIGPIFEIEWPDDLDEGQIGDWEHLEMLAEAEQADKISDVGVIRARMVVCGGSAMTARSLLTHLVRLGYTEQVFDERCAHVRGRRILRLHAFLQYPLDLAIALGKVCMRLHDETSEARFKDFAVRFDALAAGIVQSCGTEQEAEYILTQTLDRRPKRVAALLQGANVLEWALREPRLLGLASSPWVHLLQKKVWLSHSVYVDTTPDDDAPAAVHIGSKTAATVQDYSDADRAVQWWAHLNSDSLNKKGDLVTLLLRNVLWLSIPVMLSLTVAYAVLCWLLFHMVLAVRGKAHRGWFARSFRRHYILTKAVWSAPIIIFHTKLLLDLLAVALLTAVSTQTYLRVVALEAEAESDGEKVSTQELLVYAWAAGIFASELRQAYHRWELLPARPGNDFSRQVVEVWRTHVDIWHALDWTIVALVVLSCAYRWQSHPALQYSSGLELYDMDAARNSSRCLIAATVLAFVSFMYMMLASRVIGPLVAVLHETFLSSTGTNVLLAGLLCIAVTTIHGDGTDAEEFLGSRSLPKAENFLYGAFFSVCAAVIFMYDRTTGRQYWRHSHWVIERHSSILRHATEVSPFSLGFAAYRVAAMLLSTVDSGMAVCRSVDGGPVTAALKLDGESRESDFMGPRRMLFAEMAVRGERSRSIAPRFAGHDSVLQPQLKCHVRWRMAQRTAAEEERGKG